MRYIFIASVKILSKVVAVRKPTPKLPEGRRWMRLNTLCQSTLQDIPGCLDRRSGGLGLAERTRDHHEFPYPSELQLLHPISLSINWPSASH
jgi:hypothetical protein